MTLEQSVGSVAARCLAAREEADMRDEPEDELENELRRLAARVDPVPPELLRAAAGAFAWRDIDAELAELVFDSLAETDAMLVRGSPDRRLLSFAGGGLTVDVEVTATGPERTVMGQIVPPRRGQVELRRGQDTVTVEADELGRFRSGPLPPGPLSLRLRTEDGAPVVTDWLAL
jgi:hypothetical protein